MVCRIIEGFDSSTVTNDYIPKWTTEVITSIGTPYGRYGQGARFGASALLTKNLDNQATWIMGAAVRLSELPTGTSSGVFRVTDGVTHQAGIGINTLGQIFAYRSTIATVLGTPSAAIIIPLIWYYIEWRVTIGNTGSVVVRVNEAEVLNLPSVDTMSTTNAYANVVTLGPPPSGMENHVDDVYVFDTTGSTNNTFAGDVRVERIVPAGAGATTAWTPSTGSNYACVDEAPPNDDTDYVSSLTAGQTDTYAFGNLTTTSGTVFAVQASAQVRKDDAGTRTLALVARPGSTDRLGATQGATDAYLNIAELWNTNPDTSAAWTIAEVNASEFGVRLLS